MRYFGKGGEVSFAFDIGAESDGFVEQPNELASEIGIGSSMLNDNRPGNFRLMLLSLFLCFMGVLKFCL